MVRFDTGHSHCPTTFADPVVSVGYIPSIQKTHVICSLIWFHGIEAFLRVLESRDGRVSPTSG